MGLIMRFPASALSVPVGKDDAGKREVSALIAQGINVTITKRVQNKEVLGIGIGGFIAGGDTDNIDLYIGATVSVFRHWHVSPVVNVETEQAVVLLGGNWPL